MIDRAVGAISRSINLPMVDLPQPLSPTSPSVSPGAMSNETPVNGMHMRRDVREKAAALIAKLLFQDRALRAACVRGRLRARGS